MIGCAARRTPDLHSPARFVVNRAATRLLRLGAVNIPHSPFRPGQGVKPRAWQGLASEGGEQLQDLEHRWRQLYEERLAAPSLGRRRHRMTATDLDDVYHVGWMDPPVAREHWRDRRQARLAAAADGEAVGGRGAGGTQPDDSVDLLEPVPGPAPGWNSTWKRLKTFDLSRPVFFSNWITLHAALPFGACRLRTSPPDAAMALFLCPHACCAAELQTLTHMLV